MRRGRTTTRLLLALAALPVAALVVVIVEHASLAELGASAAYLVPPSLLLVILLVRGYPGERALLAAIERPHDEPHRLRAGPLRGLRLRPRVMIARGGRLIAFSLAVRPPPGSLVIAFS